MISQIIIEVKYSWVVSMTLSWPTRPTNTFLCEMIITAFVYVILKLAYLCFSFISVSYSFYKFLSFLLLFLFVNSMLLRGYELKIFILSFNLISLEFIIGSYILFDSLWSSKLRYTICIVNIFEVNFILITEVDIFFFQIDIKMTRNFSKKSLIPIEYREKQHLSKNIKQLHLLPLIRNLLCTQTRNR